VYIAAIIQRAAKRKDLYFVDKNADPSTSHRFGRDDNKAYERLPREARFSTHPDLDRALIQLEM
jgi:hypothetical protein